MSKSESTWRPDGANGPLLSLYTTFRIGGPCRGLTTCETRAELRRAVEALGEVGEEFVLLGGGSNLLVSDAGVNQQVIRYFSEKPQIARQGNELVVQAATRLDDLASYAVQEGLDGLLCCTGIPGTVGGAIVGNAGAFGEQIGDRVLSVIAMDHHANEREIPGDELAFGYRQSRLQNTDSIVVSVRLRLRLGDRDRLRTRRQEILALRAAKHPDWQHTPTAGSFFKNIEPTSKAERRQAAGWFLEQAGAKALRVGKARPFEKHANIIVAERGCRAVDVLELSRQMAALVKEKFGIELHREVRLLGSWPAGVA
ncbi:MAG: UDP-N-acetylmuramate dehydrogenase [Kiritimatiellae bacterium]|nr:UDP-N-acetylmuramate dehydrogenase [Kiritimatiellia bacterium]MCO5061331.1 UDP-N-acetylmuramate dehydrogenase [Kiritimatiellia bacterium]MCO5067592.1 UDP-N-acetylmuramate dehydrogenase [Kiritimatiellia bacterium]MCO6400159.1 UDP-N-acetylmuramate dehydrogenase [Verrucomicrobiota bacterium]